MKNQKKIKPRDPNFMHMQDLRKSGAMGAHKDKKKDHKSGYQKHKGKAMDESNYETPGGAELSKIGRILMDKAASTKDDALSNVLGRVGDELTRYGEVGGARNLDEFLKKTRISKEMLNKLMNWASKQQDTSLSKVKDPVGNNDEETDESGIMYKAGVKKYGKDGMEKIQSAAGKGASAEEIGKIKDQHNKKKKESFATETSIGHKDDEKHMIQKNLYQLASYAKETFDMVSDLAEDADFPHWWQSKVVESLAMMSKAKHYLENELAVPDVGGDGGEDVAKEGVMDKLKKDWEHTKGLAKAIAKDPLKGDKAAKDYNKKHGKDMTGKKEESVCSECGNPRFVAMPEDIQEQYHTVSEEKQKGVDGKVCWKGYKRMGTKKKGGKTVDNCVKM